MSSNSSGSNSDNSSSASPPSNKPVKREGKAKKLAEEDEEGSGSGSEDEGGSGSGSGSSGSSHSGSGSGSSDSSDQEQSDVETPAGNDDDEEEVDYDNEKSQKGSEEEDDVVEDEEEEVRSRIKSRSGSRSGSAASRSRSRSGSGSRSSRSGSRLSDSSSSRRRRKREKESFWEDNPEIYGIRRSHRQKIEVKPPKLVPQVGSKRASPKKSPAKVKRRKISSDADDSSDEENTRTVRKRPAAVSYKEQESEDENDYATDDDDDSQENGDQEPEEHVETIERVMESREGKKGATGSCTTIYAVVEKGDPNEKLPNDTEKEPQFLIKWVGWSHLHNTWESLTTLQEMKVKGIKKLDNFCKKEDQQNRWKAQATIEDVEYAECQLELQAELVKSYTNAERIIAEQKNAEGAREYYVKWESLSYSEATWESAELIKKRNPDVIKIFKRREESNRTPSSKLPRSRPKFYAVKHQPSYLKGDSGEYILRDYQLDGLNWLVHSWCKENSVILADEMGLGKTIQTICFLGQLFEHYNIYGPYLLVVPLSTMAAWQKEFAQWAPQINVVTYLGDISSRDVIRDYEWFLPGTRKIKFNAILTTYEIILKDKVFLSALPWAALVVDEAHRLKNGDSLLYKVLVEFQSNHRLLVTGTPLQNSLKELWSLLHFIMPHKFDSWESFEEEHDHSATKGYTRLHKQLEPYILRRVKKDVEKSLPAKVEQILRVEMTSIQKQYYKWILTKNYTALRKGVKGSVTSFVNVVMELKKCCNHAFLTKPLEKYAGDALTQLIKGSGKLMLLDKLLVRLRETGHRVLIFSQMVMMLDIIAEYLQLRRFSFQRLDGSIKGDMRKQALEHYNAEGSTDFCFLLSTRAGGLGINLATADTVIIFDSDWNPQNDLQAQARAHRIGQKNQVMIYRLVTKNSVEEDIVERAKQKMVLDHLVIQRMDTTGRTVLDKGSKTGTPFNKDELSAILKFGAQELFKEDDNEGEDNCDIDEILRRAETHEEAARPGDELLSAFNVASFSLNEDDLPEGTNNSNEPSEARDWEQIIPEDIRKRVEAEEKEKEMADLYLPPRSSRNASATDAKGQPLGNEALNRKARNAKRKRGNKSESDEESESDDDDGKPRKRGRPKTGTKDKEGLKFFKDIEIRKFLKSLKKFANPLARIDKVAEDCGLLEKSLGDLKKLGEQLLKGCQNAILEQKANPQACMKEEPLPPPTESESPDGTKKRPQKPREKGPIFKVCNVGINARTMSIAIEELEPLGEIMPVDPVARKKWKFDVKVKLAPFDVDWGMDEDTRLLAGIWEHGMGSWEKIRESDPILKEKIFIEGEKKPLLKHVGTRADYLLRVLKKNQVLLKLKQPKLKKPKKRGPKVKPDPDSVNASIEATIASLGPAGGAEDSSAVDGKDASRKVKRAKKKKDVGPMHFSAQAEPTPVSVLGELDPVIFTECKEKMRPVKKALKSLDNPDPNIVEKEQILQTRGCLILIGRQIESCLEQYKGDPALHKQWKSYLWYFVSKFTEYDAKKLHKVYKRALKKEKEKDALSKGEKPKDKDSEKAEKKVKGEKKDKEKKDKEKKDKEKGSSSKHKKGKEKKSSRREREETSQSSFHENSNSSQGDNYRDAKPYKSRNHQFREERDHDRGGGRDPRDRGGRYENNERIPPPNFESESFPSAPSSSFNPSPRKHTNNGPVYPPHDNYPPPNHQYRDRERDKAPGDPRGGGGGDPRDRSTGDPRNRMGHHGGKGYYNQERDRDRTGAGYAGSSPGSSVTGRSWGGQQEGKGRWAPGSHFSGSRRDGAQGPSDSPYNNGPPPSSRPVVPPPPPSIGGLSPYQGSNLSGTRVAPPLTAEEWRRSDPKRQLANLPPGAPRPKPAVPGGPNSRRYEGSSYEKY